MSALLPAAVFAAVGIAWVTSGLPSIIWYTIVLIGAAIAASAPPHASAPGFRVAIRVALCAVGLLVGAYAAGARAPASLPFEIGALRSVTGRVISAGEGWVKVDAESADAHAIEGAAHGPVTVLVAGDPPSPGTVVRFDAARGAAWRRDDGSIGVRAAGWVSLDWPATRREAIRTRIAEAADRSAGEAAPLVRALLLGESDGIDPRVELLFRHSGTIHLLALSGMHLAVIALLVCVLIRSFAGPRVATLVAIVVSIGYVWLAGPRPGLVRAALLASIAAILRAIDRDRPLAELLAIAMLVQLVVQPSAASSIAFALSYLSLFGIALVASPLAGRIGGVVPPSVASPLSAGIGAQLATTPLLLIEFGAWYPVGIVASVVLTPVILVFMTGSIVSAALAAAGVHVASRITVPVLELLARAAERVAWIAASVPGLTPERSRASAFVAALIAIPALVAGSVALYGRNDGLERA